MSSGWILKEGASKDDASGKSTSSDDQASMLRSGSCVYSNPFSSKVSTCGGPLTAIILRSFREQQEHDRVVRLLQSRLRRRYSVSVNVRKEKTAPVRAAGNVMYPDLTLTSTEGSRRLHGVVEVETAQSINDLEAKAEWVNLGKVRGAFYLYVPSGTAEIALRLCQDNEIAVTEIWSYNAVGTQMRFTMAHRVAPKRKERRQPISSKKQPIKVSRSKSVPQKSKKTVKSRKSRLAVGSG